MQKFMLLINTTGRNKVRAGPGIKVTEPRPFCQVNRQTDILFDENPSLLRFYAKQFTHDTGFGGLEHELNMKEKKRKKKFENE